MPSTRPQPDRQQDLQEERGDEGVHEKRADVHAAIARQMPSVLEDLELYFD